MDVKDGLVAIAGEVLGDVQKEAEAIILAAEEEAKKALQQAKAQADHDYLTLVNQAKDKAVEERRRIASLTELEIRNKLLQTKEELVDEAFERALGKLKAFEATTKYRAYLLRQIGDITKRIGAKKIVIQVNTKDKDWLTPEKLEELSEKLKIKLILSPQTGDFIGGCKIHTEDLKAAYDGTFENRLQELKPILRAEVAKILFQEAT
jgi:V/A-type H+/Na+-transporting ATPase subunit E